SHRRSGALSIAPTINSPLQIRGKVYAAIATGDNEAVKAPIQPEPLILASLSERRRELLRDAGYRFQVVEPAVAEPSAADRHVGAADYAESLAFFKASSVAGDYPDACILAADTIAVVDDEIIGKPADRVD